MEFRETADDLFVLHAELSGDGIAAHCVEDVVVPQHMQSDRDAVLAADDLKGGRAAGLDDIVRVVIRVVIVDCKEPDPVIVVDLAEQGIIPVEIQDPVFCQAVADPQFVAHERLPAAVVADVRIADVRDDRGFRQYHARVSAGAAHSAAGDLLDKDLLPFLEILDMQSDVHLRVGVAEIFVGDKLFAQHEVEHVFRAGLADAACDADRAERICLPEFCTERDVRFHGAVEHDMRNRRVKRHIGKDKDAAARKGFLHHEKLDGERLFIDIIDVVVRLVKEEHVAAVHVLPVGADRIHGHILQISVFCRQCCLDGFAEAADGQHSVLCPEAAHRGHNITVMRILRIFQDAGSSIVAAEGQIPFVIIVFCKLRYRNNAAMEQDPVLTVAAYAGRFEGGDMLPVFALDGPRAGAERRSIGAEDAVNTGIGECPENLRRCKSGPVDQVDNGKVRPLFRVVQIALEAGRDLKSVLFRIEAGLIENGSNKCGAESILCEEIGLSAGENINIATRRNRLFGDGDTDV